MKYLLTLFVFTILIGFVRSRLGPPIIPIPERFVKMKSMCGVDGQGVPLLHQRAIAEPFWSYQWGSAPYGTSNDISGVLQIVNGGTQPMWIRYAGNGISSGQFGWKQFITTASELNGFNAHQWNGLNQNSMVGQGDGFKLNPGEYQIVPFYGSACWFGGSLGCCENGDRCTLSPNGRSSGQDASPDGQPNTLFEWTAPGVWDASAVDGFSLPIRVEVDGCGQPFSGAKGNCLGSDSVANFNFSQYHCPNKIFNKDGVYVGCKSMCGCQYRAISIEQSTDKCCPRMANIGSIINKPDSPGGYCGCAQGECVQWLRNLFKNDFAGRRYCNAVTKMTKNNAGKRTSYCQAYDDNAGTKSYGNGIIKVTMCNNDFENVIDLPKTCSSDCSVGTLDCICSEKKSCYDNLVCDSENICRTSATPQKEEEKNCIDNEDWKDNNGNQCSSYDGCYGVDRWAVNGVSAKQACCLCGGGSRGDSAEHFGDSFTVDNTSLIIGFIVLFVSFILLMVFFGYKYLTKKSTRDIELSLLTTNDVAVSI